MGRATKVAGGVVAALAAMAGPVAEASAAPLSTSMAPAGDYVRLALPATRPFHIDINDGIAPDCSLSTSKPTKPLGTNANNQIPTVNNPNPSGSVTLTPNLLTFANCDAHGAVPTVTVTAQGQWKIAVQYVEGKPAAVHLRIPEGGLVVQSTQPVCTGTIAPDAAVTLIGTWVNGTTGPSKIKMQNKHVPVRITGEVWCLPADYTATIDFVYNVFDASNPGTAVTVS